MRILAIETSCDETGLAVFSFESGSEKLTLESHVLFSQVALHEKFGGVFPTLAKRAHTERLVPLLEEVLKNAKQIVRKDLTQEISERLKQKVLNTCPREETLVESILSFAATIEKPAIDCIAMTVGPGLEPALWVGINAAKALSILWNIPLLPINHMEGHVVTALFDHPDAKTFVQKDIEYPLLALLVSGGHTELVLMHDTGTYKKIGQTRDDAVGEAFDKVARILGLPYPGGPKISALAQEYRDSSRLEVGLSSGGFVFPRPMQHSGDYDFSYSGLKTAVLYKVNELQHATADGAVFSYSRELENDEKLQIAAAFEDAAIDVLVTKSMKAISEFYPRTFLIGGGVAGNTHLQSELKRHLEVGLPSELEVKFLIPERQFTTDNAVMIGLAAYLQIQKSGIKKIALDELRANGNLSL